MPVLGIVHRHCFPDGLRTLVESLVVSRPDSGVSTTTAVWTGKHRVRTLPAAAPSFRRNFCKPIIDTNLDLAFLHRIPLDLNYIHVFRAVTSREETGYIHEIIESASNSDVRRERDMRPPRPF